MDFKNKNQHYFQPYSSTKKPRISQGFLLTNNRLKNRLIVAGRRLHGFMA